MLIILGSKFPSTNEYLKYLFPHIFGVLPLSCTPQILALTEMILCEMYWSVTSYLISQSHAVFKLSK